VDKGNSGGFDTVKGSQTSWDKTAAQHKLSSPVGAALLFGKVMTILSSLMDPQGQSGDSVKFALSLVNIALEAGNTKVNPKLCYPKTVTT
jgi:hypothetical protein